MADMTKKLSQGISKGDFNSFFATFAPTLSNVQRHNTSLV